MDELREFVKKGLPITLSEDWDEFEKAKQLLLENEFQPDPEEPHTFIKVSTKTNQLPKIPAESSPVLFNASEAQPIYAPDRSGRHVVPSSDEPSDRESDEPEIKSTRIQFDTTKLAQNLQIVVAASDKFKSIVPNKQTVALRLSIGTGVTDNQDGSRTILMRPHLFSIGVPKRECFRQSSFLGFYPFFASLTIRPLFPDPSTVALPKIFYIPGTAVEHSTVDVHPGPRVKRITNTKLGMTVNGWSPVGFSAEHSWTNEAEEERRSGCDNCEITAVVADDGNAASLEWKIVRWSEGEQYNPDKPLKGWTKLPNPPFTKGTSVAMMEQNFPAAEWYLDSEMMEQNFPAAEWDPYSGTRLKFEVHVVVDMHLVAIMGSQLFFKSRSFDCQGFEWRNTFEIKL